jgi:hypothetical protein
LIVLGVLAAPVQNIKFAQGDSRMLPASNKAAIATAIQDARFPGQTGTPIEIVFFDGAEKSAEIAAYAKQVAAVSGVIAVAEPQVIGQDVRLVAYQAMLPRTPEAQSLIPHNPRYQSSRRNFNWWCCRRLHRFSRWNLFHSSMGAWLDCPQRSSSDLYLYRFYHLANQGSSAQRTFTCSNYGCSYLGIH